MNKEPDMTDEELKDLAKVQYWQSDATYAALAVQAHHASEKAKAHLLAYIENERPTQRQADVIAALDALILTPPVDPLEREAVELVLASKPFRTEGQRMAIRQGLAGQDQVALALAALRRGLELREGGGA